MDRPSPILSVFVLTFIACLDAQVIPAADPKAAGLPRNVRPVVCKVPGTNVDLCVNADCQTVALGVTACICRQGMVPNQFSVFECLDFNECAYYNDICRAGPYGRCLNEMGDYRCECDSRYYTTAGREHYCQRKSTFQTPFGQLLFYGNMMNDLEF